jgi:2-succinyl-5-enolpyruvyl-6-hydroxy-3-cyclohexene-1-carboxylate synthase
VSAFAAATGWPLLADPVSRCRAVPGAVTTYDALLRDDTFAAQRPDVVVRIGRPATSKVLAQWVAGCGAPVVQVGGPGVIDPEHLVAAWLPPAVLPSLGEHLRDAGDPSWWSRWRESDDQAEAAIDRALRPEAPLSEPSVARLIARHRPVAAEVVVAASMPMRDLEWFGGPAAQAHANRGANGIDGVVSTALGVALRSSAPTIVLIGDIAFVHDAGALTALAGRGADLRVVVLDNDGGGIFSFLPQATQPGGDRFEQLFGTPHGTDVVALAQAHGLDAGTVTTPAALLARLDVPGPTVTRVRTDRAENVRIHAALNDAVAAALRDG